MFRQFLETTLIYQKGRLISRKSERLRSLPAEYDLVMSALVKKIDDLINEFDSLLKAYRTADETNPFLLSQIQLFSADAERLESVHMPAIFHVEDRDIDLTRLLRKLHGEIRFPLQCPAVTRSSQELYWIDSDLNLIGMPFRADHSPLAIPIWLHELTHLIFAEDNDQQIQPLKDAHLCLGIELNLWFTQSPTKNAASKYRGKTKSPLARRDRRGRS